MESLGMIEIESLGDGSDAASLSFLDAATDEIAATSDATVRRVVFYDSSADDFDASFLNDCEPNLYYIDTATSVAEATGVSSRSGGSGGDEVYSQITPLGLTLLLECDGFPSGGGIAESFFRVVVPNLGSTSRALRVTPSTGSGAILNQDYMVVANSPDVEGPVEAYGIGGGYFDVSGGATFYVVPLNESVIEAKENFSLGLSVVEYGSGGGTVAELEPITASIVDDDTFSLDSVKFRNHLNLRPDPTLSNLAPDAWTDPHWVKNHPELTLPVAYDSYGAMICNGDISGEIDSACTYQIRAVWEYNGQTYTTDWEPHSDSNTSDAYVDGTAYVTFKDKFKDIFGGCQAYYNSSFTLKWEFKIDGEEIAREFGKSVNTLYVTYAAPNIFPLYHTVVHTACKAANGKNTEIDVFNAIWNKFKLLNIKKVKVENGAVVEGETLTYYGRAPHEETMAARIMTTLAVVASSNSQGYEPLQDPSRVRENRLNYYDSDSFDDNLDIRMRILLAGLDGTCDDWQVFALNVLNSQGVNATTAAVSVMKPDKTPGQYDALQVKTSLIGQGGGEPGEKIWPGHALIRYNDVIYDPSYGIDYGPVDNAAQNFISEALVSVGNITSISPEDHGNYGRFYAPQKTSAFEINKDLYFSWEPSGDE